MNALLTHDLFFNSFSDSKDYSKHGTIIYDPGLKSYRLKNNTDSIDAKVCTLSHQLFSLKTLISQNPKDCEFYQKIANQIFVEKYGSIAKRGKWDRAVSALGNFFMGRGCASSDHLLKKINRASSVNKSLPVVNKSLPVVTNAENQLHLPPEKFTKKILESPLYSDKEKNMLPLDTYLDEKNLPVHKKTWVDKYVSIDYFKQLSLKNPKFRIIPTADSQYFRDQFLDKNLKPLVKDIVSYLPPIGESEPTLFAHPIQVNGNHRTVLVIDVEMGAVEYYNSFGSDSSVRDALNELAKSLSVKYNKEFSYIHATDGIRLQNDTYECGIWVCKFVEERIKQGPSFDPKSCKKDVSKYRKYVYDKVYKFRFYKTIGENRLNKYQKSKVKKEDMWDHKWLFRQYLGDRGCDAFNYQWGKEGTIPIKLNQIINAILKS